ncbi:Pinin [Biomphalaria pfeifferi]|uniref:Pinin n=1 Tax=Biomphalaria pfeifferi TaxID=112525 RepID=A0AAD8AYW7_BIOPF|nr:Pinin [Biomphalaria pfeifferi]
MALDQAHERNNAIIKGEGGAVGLTENPLALRRWMIGGSEVSKVLQDLELSFEIKRSKESDQHHEQDKGFQENFKAAVCRLMNVIQETGYPFVEKSAELVTLHDNNIVDAAVHKTLSNIHKTGVAQYNKFMQERLINMTKPVSAPIRRNNFILIAGAKRKKRSAPQYRISSLKSDCYLFSRLYVACQTRNRGLTDFFSYENQSAPPSLSCDGRMRVSNKLGLLECLEPLQTSSAVPTVTDMTILDGAAVINMLRPGSAKTFADYANQVFIPYVMQTLQNVSHRLDVVWDCYRSDSLKAFTRERRGLEKRKRVMPETVLPSQWGSFLRVDANKTQLFAFLARYLLTVQSEKLIVTTQGPDVISNKPIDHTNLSPCNHEEADTRMMLHLAHAAEHCRRILIRTVDTDVVVLSVAAMTRHPHLQLWIAMGAGKDFRYIAAHDISKVLGVAKAQCLPLFHSFTGCDTVSCFNGIGKKTAWEVWSKCDHVTATFQKLCCAPFELTANDMSVLERFVTLLYDRGSNCHDVNSARKYRFTNSGRQIENIPPTSEALFQHCKRAIYQGGHIWSQAHERQPVLPDPSDWGRQFMDRQWQPFWTVLPQASLTCPELLKCACKKECRSKRCKCNKAGLKCTALCSCVCGADFPVQHPVQAFNTN